MRKCPPLGRFAEGRIVWQNAGAGEVAASTRTLTTDRMERDQMAAVVIHPESVFARFWRDEGHASAAPSSKWANYAVALFILNEIRGMIVAGSVAWQIWG